MRTVFVPYVLLPESQVSLDPDEVEDERERLEAGNEERTVVLCVEVENSGESGPNVDFLVEKVDVKIGGEGAKATLIGWGGAFCSRDAEVKTFPLQVGAMSQYNLLYAVSFLRPPEEVEAFSLSRDPQNHRNNSVSELQRPVSINIFGKPYSRPSLGLGLGESYPTRTFASRWNCVLDLSVHQGQSYDKLEEDLPGRHHALPEPASPFPVSTTPRIHSPHSAASSPQTPAVAGSKRHTVPPSFASRSLRSATPNRASTPTLNSPYREREHSPLSSRMSFLPPSISAQIPRSPTTYSAPPPPPLDPIQSHGLPNPSQNDEIPPPTPAYPAYPPIQAAPPTPLSQGPIASQSAGNVGPAVELPRERGAGMNNGAASTPGPWVTGAFGEHKVLTQMLNAEESGEAIVVSIGLLPVERTTRNRQGGEGVLGPGKIHPMDRFTLDIFVFNQSTWTRRFEITYPERRRKRKAESGKYDGMSVAAKMGLVGILPMDSRVRIG
jgi:hypothetical protein